VQGSRGVDFEGIESIYLSVRNFASSRWNYYGCWSGSKSGFQVVKGWKLQLHRLTAIGAV